MNTISKTHRLFQWLLCLGSSIVLAQASEFKLPDYEKYQLNNGLTVYLLEQHEVPLIEVRARIRSGAIDSPIQGLADVTASALKFGSGEKSKQTIDLELDFLGAEVDSWADKEQMGINASFAKKDQTEVLTLVRNMLTSPSFDNNELEKHLQRYAAQIKERQESPKAVIGEYFEKMAFGSHLYATPVMASQQSLVQINRQQIQDFYHGEFAPDNTVLVVAGDFAKAAMKQQIAQLFDSWTGAKKGAIKSQAEAVKPLNKASVLLVDKQDAIETTFYIGGLGVARDNPDWVAIQIVNTILGGRFTSWLNDELRVNSGLTYGAKSYFDSYKHAGSFYISTFTAKSTTKEAIDLALKTYQRLWANGVDKATLDSAKAYVKGQFPPRYETSGQLANLLADMEIYALDAKVINQFSTQVDALSLEQVQQIVAQYFPRENLQFVLVGKAEEIREIAKSYGDVSEVRLQ